MRLGWFRPVHCKSMAAQEVRALLTARKLVQSKLYDIEMSLRGILRGFGLKAGDYKVVHMVPKGKSLPCRNTTKCSRTKTSYLPTTRGLRAASSARSASSCISA